MSIVEALALTALVAFIVVMVVLFRPWRTPHRVIDYGEGSVRIRCPDTEDELVLYGHGQFILCPSCGKRLRPPTKRSTWEDR